MLELERWSKLSGASRNEVWTVLNTSCYIDIINILKKPSLKMCSEIEVCPDATATDQVRADEDLLLLAEDCSSNSPLPLQTITSPFVRQHELLCFCGRMHAPKIAVDRHVEF